MVEQVSAEQAKQNAAEISERFRASGAEQGFLSQYTTEYAKKLSSDIIPEAVAVVSRYENTVTIDELMEAENIDPEDDRRAALLLHAVTAVYAVWVDKFAIMDRPDNIFNPEGEVPDGWEGNLRTALANLVLAKGKYIRFHRNIYGWMDWKETEHSKGNIAVVAAFNLKEDFWNEFGDTMVGNLDKQGFMLTVMHEDGVFRHLRYEGELGEIIRDITAGPYA